MKASYEIFASQLALQGLDFRVFCSLIVQVPLLHIKGFFGIYNSFCHIQHFIGAVEPFWLYSNFVHFFYQNAYVVADWTYC